MRQFETVSSREDLTFTKVQQILTDLVIFVLVDGIDPDPMKRGGRPKRSRQLLLADQGIFDDLMLIASVPFEGTLFQPEAELKPNDHIFYTCRLAMRLSVLCLQDCLPNKLHATKHALMLQGMLGRFNFGVMNALTAIYSDNEVRETAYRAVDGPRVSSLAMVSLPDMISLLAVVSLAGTPIPSPSIPIPHIR